MIFRVLIQATFDPTTEKKGADLFREENPDFIEEIGGTRTLSFTKERIYSADYVGEDEA